MWSLIRWQPGCWCAAVLKLTDQHVVWESEDEGTRYPEQWMYALWRPTAQSKPLTRPDIWGLTVGHPRVELCKLVDSPSNVYLLSEEECLWSSWLAIPLVCDRLEPWLSTAISQKITEQGVAERVRYARWFGDEQSRFNRFLNGVISQPKSTGAPKQNG